MDCNLMVCFRNMTSCLLRTEIVWKWSQTDAEPLIRFWVTFCQGVGFFNPTPFNLNRKPQVKGQKSFAFFFLVLKITTALLLFFLKKNRVSLWILNTLDPKWRKSIIKSTFRLTCCHWKADKNLPCPSVTFVGENLRN